MGRMSLYSIGLYISCTLPIPVLGQETVTPVPYTSPLGVYEQNFNELPNTGSFGFTGKGPFNISSSPINAANLPGWQFWMKSGSNTNTGFAISTGSSTGSNVYSLGSSASAERALGTLASGSGTYSIGAIFINHTNSNLNKCTISFTMEQWRKGGSGNLNTWQFRYKTGLIDRIDATETIARAELDMKSIISTSAAATLNGNLAENQKIVSFTLENILWKKGENLLLRWDDTDETGSDDAMAIDNFSFVAKTFTAPPTVASQPATAITPHSAGISGILNTGFGNTAVWFIYDTTSSFANANTLLIADSVTSGISDTVIATTLSNLQAGSIYYYRMAAANITGTTIGNTISFTTLYNTPSVTTKHAANIRTSSALLGGNIISTSGTAITEKGIVWALTSTLSIADNKIIVDTISNDYTKLVSQLPKGTLIYARAYAINTVNTAYGNTISFTTATSVLSLTNVSAQLTNAATVQFRIHTEQAITGLSPSNFSIVTNSIDSAAITRVSGSANHFIITVHTGSGNGNLSVQFINDTHLSAPIENKPFVSTAGYIIDKSPPKIFQVSIPNTPMKYGDTVEVTVRVLPDADNYFPASLQIAGLTATQFRKLNDSMYKATLVIKNTEDIAGISDIPVHLILKDAAGNNSNPYTISIVQSLDAIDITRPMLTVVQLPANKTYKAGDTLDFVFRFSEKIALSDIADFSTVSITVGSRSKACRYVSGNRSDSLHYRYIIAIDESDKDGVRFSSPLTFRNTSITDFAGNPASINFSFPSSAKIIVDAVLPKISSVGTPEPAVYKTGNLLDFTVHFSKKVWVDTTNAKPYITIQIGNTTRNIYYAGGEGSNALLFRYKITKNDLDKDGITLDPSIQLNNARIFDDAGNTALLTLKNIGTLSSVIVNPPVITIAGISLPSDGWYGKNSRLGFTLQYNENAFVDTTHGSPSLRLTAGTTYKYAVYQSGSGSRELHFAYIVQPNDLDTSGIAINSTIILNNGLITDENRNIASSVIPLNNSTTGILLDAVQPVVKSVITPAKKTYRKGDTLGFTVVFSEKIVSSGDADSLYIFLNIGSQKRKAFYQSGMGTSSLLFSYTVQRGDNDTDGIKLDSIISNAANLLHDWVGNSVVPVLKNIGAVSGIRTTTALPQLISDSSQISICGNQSVGIENLLRSKYEERGVLLQWQINRPMHGSVSTQIITALSNGGIITPGSIRYTPDSGYTGKDSLLISLTDSSGFVQKTIYFLIHQAITDNTISPSQNICSTLTPSLLSGSIPSGGNGNYSFIWEATTGNDSLYFLTATAANTSQHYQPGKLSSSTWFRRKAQSGACENISAPVCISVFQKGFWTGSFDSLWNNPNNWCMQSVPDDKTDVVVDNKAIFAPYINESAKCHHLILSVNSSLVVKGKLELYGHISSPPEKINALDGTIAYSGTRPQLLSAESFTNHTLKNLVINNPAGVATDEQLVITGSLLLNNGLFSTNDKIKLTASAMVAPSAANTSILGNLSIAYHIPGGRSAFRLMGHPFTKPITPAMIKDSIDITGEGGATNGFTPSLLNQSSAFLFHPEISNDSTGFEAGWQTASHIGTLWKQNTGIRLMVRGKPGQGLDGTPTSNGSTGSYYPAPVHLLFTGPVHTGNQELVLPKNIHPTYHVICNPYPCPIDLSLISRGSGIAPHYWLWDPWQGNTGAYTSIRSSDNYILPTFGTFIVRVNENTENYLRFTENSKATTATTATTARSEGNFIELKLESGNLFWDKLTIFTDDNARIYADEKDAEKFNNNEVNFYSLSRDKKALSTDTRPLNNESAIPLGLQTALRQSFTIRISDINMPANNTLQLHDRYLKQWIPLMKDSTYTFSTTDDSLSYGEHRFEIRAYKKEVFDTAAVFKLSTNISPVPVYDKLNIRFSAPIPGNTFIRLLSQNGNTIKQAQLGLQKNVQLWMQIADIRAGIYLLEIKCGEYSAMQKIIKQ